jgi:crossover junction endodeoxyribonuclease RuvC
MRILGIDPGLSGALVLLEKGIPVEWAVTPTVMEGKSNRVNAVAVARIIHQWQVDICYMEAVHAMPGNGSSSMFNFGHATGTIKGVLGALEVPVRMVTPQAWKKHVGLLNKDKDAARSLAIDLWPSWEALDKKGEGQALADAALIARYGS